MKPRILRLLATLPLLVACAGPRPPDWQADASGSLENFRKNYLAGKSRLAERDFAEARASIAGTGKLELAARAELFRCALATAALEFDACASLEPAMTEATAEDQAYGRFLIGSWGGLDAGALPSPYHSIVHARDEAGQNRSAQKIGDPLSRLVAAGVLLRLGRISPDSVAVAVDTASDEGFRRPLLAWLNVQARLAQASGDTARLETVRKRIDLVYRSLPRETGSE